MAQAIPTKGNLMAQKRSLTLAYMGFDLMDRKRNILIREIMGLIDYATELQGQIDAVFSEAYRSLQSANITLGICFEVAKGIPLDDSVSIRTRSIMGVEIPLIPDGGEDIPKMTYGFHTTNSMLDDAYIKFHRVRQLTRKLAETETTIYRLAFAIKKTQKRANALQNIIIPNTQATVKFITDALEEKDREEFGRLKVIKEFTAKK